MKLQYCNHYLKVSTERLIFTLQKIATMKIDTIAEVHPLNILEGFMCLGLLGHGEQNDLSARFFGKESSHIKDPAAITSDVFWRSYASECRRLMVQCKEKSEH